MGHHAPRMSTSINHKDYHEHRPDGKPMHHLPRIVDHDKLLINPTAERHAGEDDNIDAGQEDAEILLRREPQTDIREALESTAQFEVACNITDGAKQRQSPLAKIATDEPQ